MPIILSTVLAGGLAVGCASAPKQIPELDQARADVQSLQQQPKAQQIASQELSNAQKSLDAAEAAMEKRDKDDVLHYAFLASQQAKAGQEVIARDQAHEQVAQGEADRNRVLLEARTREAQAEQQKAEAAKQEALSAQTQAEQARTEAADAQKQLSDLQAKQTDRGMVLTLGDVLFDTAQATLKPGAQSQLDRIASFMQQNEGTKVIIEGHTDSRGSDSYNQDLSQRRAQAVADALASHGIDRSRVEAIGRGKELPVASNDSAAGQQQNRRVEIVFSDPQGRFASGASGTLR